MLIPSIMLILKKRNYLNRVRSAHEKVGHKKYKINEVIS